MSSAPCRLRLAARPWRWMLSAVLAVAIIAEPLAAQQDERAVRAALTFNVTRYVTWPEPVHDLVLCYEGDAGAGAPLKSVLEGKSSDGRTIHVLFEPSDLAACNVLYLSDSASARHLSPLSKFHTAPILTVGESEKFVRSGGMVALVRTGDQIRIEVNLETLRGAGLNMSSRLLDLAFIVHSARRD